MSNEKDPMSAYLGKGIKSVGETSSILKSSSRWLNNGVVRDVMATWLLRKNGPDFPVEADHTLGLMQAIGQVQPDEEVEALMQEEYRINPGFRDWIDEGFVSRYTNDDFNKYAPGTVGGIMGYQIRECGFDITLGVDWSNVPKPEKMYDYWRLRARQTHDFEHIVTGGQFNSIGELPVVFARWSNHTAHLSPKLAGAVNTYLMFTGLRMVTRALLHYPEIFPKVLETVEQGIKVGRDSAPMWTYKFEDVFDMTPEQAREHFGVKHAYEIDSEQESIIFREDAVLLAAAAE